jgi:hypothetical protein
MRFHSTTVTLEQKRRDVAGGLRVTPTVAWQRDSVLGVIPTVAWPGSAGDRLAPWQSDSERCRRTCDRSTGKVLN